MSELHAFAHLREQRDEIQKRFDALYADSMVAHRWFSEQFGEIMNGRDFATKCPMATVSLTELQEILNDAISRLTELKRDVERYRKLRACMIADRLYVSSEDEPWNEARLFGPSFEAAVDQL